MVRRVALAALVTLSLTACKPGCGQRGEPRSEEERVAAALDAVGAPEVPFELAAQLPGDADAYVVADVRFLTARSAAIAPGFGSADEMWESVRPQIEALSASPDFPAAFRAGIHPERIHRFAAAAWSEAVDGSEGPSWVALTDVAFLAAPPGEDAEPVPVTDGVRMAVRRGNLVFGDGPVFDAVVAGDAGPGFTGTDSWPEGWATLPDDAGVAVLLPHATPDFPDTWKDAGLSRVLVGGSPGASTVLAVDIVDGDLLSNQLGAAQHALSSQISAWRMMAPPFAQGWVDYLDLAARALWSQVSLERTGTLSVVRVSAPRCGTGAGSVYVLAGLAWLGATEARTFEPVPFEPIEQRIADDCGPVPGPPPALPIRFTGIPGTATTGEQLLVLADVGALLRQNLPTFFHLLPFALHPDDVVTALGPTPLGMAGLTDPNGVVAAYVDMERSDRSVAVLPAGARGFLPLPVPPGLTSEVVEGVGWVIGGGDAAAAAAAAPTDDSAWARLARALPDDAILAAITTPESVADIVAEIPSDVRVVTQASLLAAAVDADLAGVLAFYVGEGASEIAAATEGDIDRLLAAGAADLDDAEAQLMQALMGPVREHVTVEASGDDVVLLRIGSSGAQGRAFLVGGIAAALVVPRIVEELDPMGSFPIGAPQPVAVPATVGGGGGKPPAAPLKPPR